MAAVHKIAGGFTVSISTLATEFGMDRKTVARRLDASGITPADQVRGYPVYRLRDAVKAIFGLSLERRIPEPDEGSAMDPTRLPPMERRAWYQSENERLEVERKKGQLVPASTVEAEFAVLIKGMVQRLDTLADVLERDAALTPAQVEIVQRTVDSVREEMYRDQQQQESDAA